MPYKNLADQRAAQAAWAKRDRKNNPERWRLQKKLWRKRHPEKYREELRTCGKRRREKYPEKEAERKRNWKKNNPEKWREAKRRGYLNRNYGEYKVVLAAIKELRKALKEV